MSYTAEYAEDLFAIDAAADERMAFVRRTYLHLCGAILGFVALTAIGISTPAIAQPLTELVFGHWWIAFVLFLVASFVAQRWAESGTAPAVQYAGLALYTVAQAVIFIPLMYIASTIGGDELLPTAGFLTMLIFGGLTAVVFITRTDFSFLRYALWLGSMAAFGVIIASFFFGGLTLGIIFPAAMVVLMSGYILYYTSNVLHHYRTDQHVAAALALFACLATLFWYVIQLLWYLQGSD